MAALAAPAGGQLTMQTVPAEHFSNDIEKIWSYIFDLRKRQQRPRNLLTQNQIPLRHELAYMGWVELPESKGKKRRVYKNRIADDLRRAVHALEDAANSAASSRKTRFRRYVVCCDSYGLRPRDIVFVRWDFPDDGPAGWDLALQKHYYAKHFYRTSLDEDLKIRNQRVQSGLRSIVLTLRFPPRRRLSLQHEQTAEENVD